MYILLYYIYIHICIHNIWLLMKIYQSGMVIVVRQKLHIGISTTYHVEWISMGPHRPSMAGTSPFSIYVPGINLHLDRGFSQAHPKNHQELKIGRVSRSRSRSKAPRSNDWRRRPRDRWNRWNQWIKPSLYYFFLLSIHMKYNMFVNTRFVCTIKSINLHYECTINAYQMHCTVLLVCMNLPCLHSFFCSTTITTSDLCFISVLLMYSELV